MTLFLLVIIAVLSFEFINGFHDTANSIATVVSTKVLTPRQAVMMAATVDLAGALIMGTSVAMTIGAGLVDVSVITMPAVLCALLGAIFWNLFTWWLGLPSSSSHALIGGLCGAAVASAHCDLSVLHWSSVDAAGNIIGIWPKVIMPMLIAPCIGFGVAVIVMSILYIVLKRVRPRFINMIFGKLQIVSAAWMGFSHGSNDAQKGMGIVTLALCTATTSGLFDDLPSWLSFLRTPEMKVHTWVILLCGITMAAGTAMGGWRIIKTMGHKMVKLQPINGFAAETSAACVIVAATHFGVPLSTTHVISTSIMGVGAVKRFSAVKWGIVGRIVWAWVLTLPITCLVGFGLMRLAHVLFTF
ncbi:PiT family inorganic phosphate transporter [Ereboglobus sp. PH5-10]|uniref:inorganic phosphate transporter n=1 Tax=Ereboglobus sp. PH5-10 TaxID=2940629 RepID=UPI002405143B|nr:inorganic phosphate transporter [Ereboglobus sp. PH5-10]MDF9827632.1 PiT family inorganic phosphate transporter [Ereboglobus sp. PH5-10]